MLRDGRCYQCFGEMSGYIDCPSGPTYTAFANSGSNVRRQSQTISSRILSFLEDTGIEY